MRRPAPQFQVDSHIQDEDERILPLINVVFLLLIFFIIVGSFSQVEPFEIEPLVSDASGNVDETPLVLHMGAQGQLAIGEQPVALEGLGEKLQAMLSGKIPETLWIKADGSADATRLVMLMEQLRNVGVQRLRLLTIQREQ